MRSLFQHRCLTGDFTLRIDQFRLIQIAAAFFALVAASFRELAIRAGSFHVAIGEKHPGCFIIKLLLFFPF